MKKIIALLLLISSTLGLASCKNRGSDLPEGMQLVRGGSEIGYYMYAPEEWTVANLGEISAAYASNVDSSSVSYVEAPMPDVSAKEYFENGLTEFKTPPTVVTENKEIAFGNAEAATAFIYEHTYDEQSYRTMQIYATFEGRFGIFTFNSPLANISSKELLQYDYYQEKIDNVIKNFKYVTKNGTQEKVEYPTVDGWRLVSDKQIAKFNLYLPEEYEVLYSSGIVTAALEDGSSVSLTRVTAAGMVISDYWENRKKELSQIADSITEIHANEPGKLGDLKQVFLYEYTYVYNGVTYHVYQMFGVNFFDGFAFTYTATEENYSSHIEAILKIAEKVEF